jgi:hypothetical protein
MENHGWIGVDLDGTLAVYDGWRGADHIGEPVPAMLARVKAWLAEGRDVRIFTARVWKPSELIPEFQARAREADAARDAIVRWCQQHVGRPLAVTCMKDYSMIELWDDRAVQVIPNTGVALQELINQAVG